jgi:2-methylcitrate dehydratase PrpD
MANTAQQLAEWAHALTPTDADLRLAQHSLVDTVAVALAARDHPLTAISAAQGEAGHWSTTGHVLDFDDLHMESTTHISVVIVPAVLATGGDERAYLAGAGVMARLGNTLGWTHYEAGWHATCTAGAPGAAVAAAISLGLTVEETAHAIALAIPAAGGVQRAFGSAGKPLQVGFAADAGVRAARLAQAGARSDLTVVDQWLVLVQARNTDVVLEGDAVPGGLATKLFPCCYAMQRPIGAMRAIRDQLTGSDIVTIGVRTPATTVVPLIHARPHTGLEGKFSLEYSLASVVLDGFPDFVSFTDSAVGRPEAQDLIQRVKPIYDETDDDNLLAGDVRIDVELANGETVSASLEMPPGSPARPATEEEFAAKLAACGADVPALVDAITWTSARELLRRELPVRELSLVAS